MRYKFRSRWKSFPEISISLFDDSSLFDKWSYYFSRQRNLLNSSRSKLFTSFAKIYIELVFLAFLIFIGPFLGLYSSANPIRTKKGYHFQSTSQAIRLAALQYTHVNIIRFKLWYMEKRPSHESWSRFRVNSVFGIVELFARKFRSCLTFWFRAMITFLLVSMAGLDFERESNNNHVEGEKTLANLWPIDPDFSLLLFLDNFLR